MALIGEVIKRALSLKEQIRFDRRTPADKQRRELLNLLGVAKDTAFGKYYGFQSMLNTKSDVIHEFRTAIPIHSYEDIYTIWWQRQVELPDITWPGKPDYFALTSGTTGSESKKIPVTDEFMKSMRKVGLDQLSQMAQLDVPDTLFSSEPLVISSSADLDKRAGHFEGEISGINVSNFPEWYNLFYRPGNDIAAIDDWDERTDKIAREAKNWNIGVIAGIPSWVQMCLKKVIEVNSLEYIDDIWPNAGLFLSGGVAFETYDRSFRRLFRNRITVLDTYLASEGFIAYGVSESDLAMKLALSHGYFFEFIPFDESGFEADGSLKDSPTVLTIDEVQPQREYALLISTCAGAWRYMIGDTIKFIDRDLCNIKLTGRTKYWLNVVGSQLTEEKLDNAVNFLSNEAGVDINEYSVGCLNIDGDYIHQWVLVTDDELDQNAAAKIIDTHLKELNKNYGVARSKALKDVKVHVATKGNYEAWLRKEKKLGGQIKVQKVMPTEDLHKYLEFITPTS